ncbi:MULTISPECIES: IS5 family transposase [unclassified Streptomyces]|uniref:IS5 family transposase n=1 Tax=unclassified Streptomyces TaxID=2593676 RepID=UPI003369BE5F
MSLSDAQWARIEPLLPDRTPMRGGRWRDHREVIDAIAFKFQTGTQWVHLPEKYGNWRGVYNRLRRWAVDGTWERVFTALMAQADTDEDHDWAVSEGSTIVRAHQHAAGARKRGPGRRTRRPCHRTVPRRTDHQDPPGCRCRLSASGFRPHRRTSRRCTRLHRGHGPPACSPPTGRATHQTGVVLADRAYSSRAIREHLRRRGIRAVIPGLHIAGIFLWSAR